MRLSHAAPLALLSVWLAVPVRAETDWSKLWSWVKDQNPRAGTYVSLDASPSAAAYLRGPSLGQRGLSSDPKLKRYVDSGLGVLTSFNGGAEPLVLVMLHPANLAGPLSSWLPFKSRIQIPGFPDIEMGPAFKLPVPHRAWTWRGSFGLVLSLGF